jgi:hypothetical protein
MGSSTEVITIILSETGLSLLFYTVPEMFTVGMAWIMGQIPVMSTISRGGLIQRFV